MFNLPKSTEIIKNNTLNKNTLGNKQYAMEVAEILIINEISANSVNIPADDFSFFVVQITFREDTNADEILKILEKNIKQRLIFVSECGTIKYSVFYKSKLYSTHKMPKATLTGTISDVYENLVAQIIGVTVKDTLENAVLDYENRLKLQREITALERKIKAEKQFNKKVELNAKLKKLKEQLND